MCNALIIYIGYITCHEFSTYMYTVRFLGMKAVFNILCLSLFWCASLYVLSRFAIMLTRKRELVALLLLSFECLVTVNDMWLFLTVPTVSLQFVIVVFPDHAQLLFCQMFIFWFK